MWVRWIFEAAEAEGAMEKVTTDKSSLATTAETGARTLKDVGKHSNEFG